MSVKLTDRIRRLFHPEKGPSFFAEKRNFERVPAKVFMRLRDTQTNRWGLVQTEDLSIKGIGLVSEKELLPRTPLEIWLPIIDTGEKLYTKGSVAWSKQSGMNKYRVGVELENPESMDILQVIRQ